MTMTAKTPEFLRTERRTEKNTCGLIEVAPLWPKTGENLGTLARTCDAVGACMVLPHDRNATKALKCGNTIGVHNVCVHWIKDPIGWLSWQPSRVVAVELAHDAIGLAELPAATEPTVLLLGNEATGTPKEAWPYIDQAVEIPMFGVGNSLNVAVAGSLAVYKLAGLS